jgi:hypothetical protein
MKTGTWFMQFSENNFSLPQKIKYSNVDVNYKLASAQNISAVELCSSGKSFEFGVWTNCSGERKFKVILKKENNTINGTTLLAKDIIDISKFNFIRRNYGGRASF